jgi:hypothetical protein
VVRYNISQNDGRMSSNIAAAGICIGGANTFSTEVYNNTVFMSPTAAGPTSPAIRILGTGGPTSGRVRNNIFVTTGGAPVVQLYPSATTNQTFQGNVYWSSGGTFKINWRGTTYNSLSAWRAATGQEKNGTIETGLEVDPRLTAPGAGGTIGNPFNLSSLSAYKLQSDSPLIDTGLNLTTAPWNLSVGLRDYYGNALPQGSAYDVGAHEFTVVEPTPTPTPVVVPSAPSNLSAAAASRTQINLSWADNSNNESGFAVERSPDGATWSQLTTTTTTSYVNTGLTRNRMYYYRVRAYNNDGSSGYSNTASAKTLK